MDSRMRRLISMWLKSQRKRKKSESKESKGYIQHILIKIFEEKWLWVYWTDKEITTYLSRKPIYSRRKCNIQRNSRSYKQSIFSHKIKNASHRQWNEIFKVYIENYCQHRNIEKSTLTLKNVSLGNFTHQAKVRNRKIRRLNIK